MTEAAPKALADTVLVVDDEALVRLAIAGYLRDCGYRVVEAASRAEAVSVLSSDAHGVRIVLAAVENGAEGFGLARWVREHRPGLEVVLAGSPARAADAAAEICDKGPLLARPYDPQLVVDRIRRLLARRPQGDGS
jgi:CheY-like chemotaxis protein